jgi:hypothetical protein
VFEYSLMVFWHWAARDRETAVSSTNITEK